MPTTPTYPGVYIQEIPSGVHTIVGVATSITAFLGRAAKGPLNEQTLITSFADYNRTFGGLEDYSTMSFAVRDFFNNGGSQAVIVRLFQIPGSADGTAASAVSVGARSAAQDVIDQLGTGRPAAQTLAASIADRRTVSTTSVSVARLVAQAVGKVGNGGEFAKTAQQVVEAMKTVQAAVEGSGVDSLAKAEKAADTAVVQLARDPKRLAEARLAAQQLAQAVHQAAQRLAQTVDPSTTPPTPIQATLLTTLGHDVVDPIVASAVAVVTAIGTKIDDAARTAAQGAVNDLMNKATESLALRGAAETIVNAVEGARSNPNDDTTVDLSIATAAVDDVVDLVSQVNDNVKASKVTTLQQARDAAQAAIAAIHPEPGSAEGAAGALLSTALANWAGDRPKPAEASATTAQAMVSDVLAEAQNLQKMVVGTTALAAVRAEALKLRDPATAEFTQADVVAANAVAAAAASVPGQNTGPMAIAAQEALRRATGETIATIRKPHLWLNAANPGTWGARLRARVEAVLDENNLPSTKLFTLSVSDGVTIERFPNLSIDQVATYVGDVLEKQSALVRWVESPNPAVPDPDPDPKGKDPFGDDLDPATGKPFNTRPNNADRLTDGIDLDKSVFVDFGFPALLRADLINLVCIPPYMPEGQRTDVDSDVYDAALAFCQTKRSMLIVDPPSSWTSVKAAEAGPIPCARDPNAALFFPRVNMPNPLKNNRKETFVASGAIAGVFARTDATRGVWKAPAGLDATISGVSELAVKVNDADNGRLNPLAVNCLRVFPVVGAVVWGARTLRGADQLSDVDNKYIPVRRFTLFLEESLYRGTQFAVFEPNDEPLWGQIRMTINAFLQDLFRQHAFAGRTPAEAYFVQCDATTTTPDDINLGIVNAVVGFAPLKPAEFVVIQIQQLAGQTVI